MLPIFQQPKSMQHSHSNVPMANIPRSVFNLSRSYKTSLNEAYLVPFFVEETLPGDTWKLSVAQVTRMITPIAPLMDNLYIDFHFFAVPFRILWENWKYMCGEHNAAGAQDTDYTVPVISPTTTFGNAGLFGYFGCPTGVSGIEVNAWWSRAYNMIYNNFYRDQNLQDELTVDIDDGPDDEADYILKKRNKRYDYFTGCLPYQQKGDAVELPLGTTAPVEYISGLATEGLVRISSTDALAGNVAISSSAAGHFSAGAVDAYYDPNGTLEADLSSATAATINSLREAIQLQHILELEARSGTRYPEWIQAHFGVTNPDARMQRPEYLGGGTSRITVQPIAGTESTTGDIGDLGGTVYSTDGNAAGFEKSFTEHCVLMGIMSIRADLTYQQGMHRMWFRQTKYDYYLPANAHLSEQPVYNKELYCDGSANDDLVFGYQERWAEYRHGKNLVTGKLNSTDASSIDHWHLAQEFGSLPTLNSDFITEAPPIDRVCQVPSQPHFVFDGYLNIRATRPLPVYSVPGLVNHL